VIFNFKKKGENVIFNIEKFDEDTFDKYIGRVCASCSYYNVEINHIKEQFSDSEIIRDQKGRDGYIKHLLMLTYLTYILVLSKVKKGGGGDKIIIYIM
jgi:hypothetical protein